MGRVQDKVEVALVTGGASSVDRGTVQPLLDEGGFVVAISGAEIRVDSVLLGMSL